jgi:putative SOS response-associated peptidase YedK
MCRRLTQKNTWTELAEVYAVMQPPRIPDPRCNIAPTTIIVIVRVHNGAHELISMGCGLIPAWRKKAIRDMPATFDARAETIR